MRRIVWFIVFAVFLIGGYSYATGNPQSGSQAGVQNYNSVMVTSISGSPTGVPTEFKGYGNFPVWEYAPAYGITTYIFLKTVNDSDTFTIFLYGSDGSTVGSCTVDLNSNQSELIDVASIVQSDKLAALTDDYARAGYYLGNGSIWSSKSTPIVVFVDVFFSAQKSGFSVPFYQ